MTVLPYLAAMLALTCYALMGPVAKKVGADIQPLTFIALVSLLLTIVAAIAAFVFERGNFSEAVPKLNWSWVAVYIAANFLSYAGYLWAISRIPVAQFEMFGIFVPVIGGFFAWLILKEPFHARYFLALAVMAAGILIAVGPELKAK
jgi:drug/metabolite transporter (DMT)-like permease